MILIKIACKLIKNKIKKTLKFLNLINLSHILISYFGLKTPLPEDSV